MVKRLYFYFFVFVIFFLVLVNFLNNVWYFGIYVSKNLWDFMNYGVVWCDDF